MSITTCRKRAVVFVASYPDGAARSRLGTENGGGDGKPRKRLRLNPHTCIGDRLRDAIGKNDADAQFDCFRDRRIGASPITVLGLLLLSSCDAKYNGGPLTCFGAELEALRDYYAYPLGDYSLKVEGQATGGP